MKKGIILIAMFILLISAGILSYRLWEPSEVRADSCPATCGQTFNSVAKFCKAECGTYYASTSSDLPACKTGCALYMTKITSCSGQVVNTLP